MSGALKHFFDTVYYPCLDATVGPPFGVYVHGNDDTAGALASIQRITRALRWKQVAAPLSLTGAPGPDDLEAVPELAAARAGGPWRGGKGAGAATGQREPGPRAPAPRRATRG